ncbi:hypothetical protein ACQPT2_11520 [Erwinia amylovora]
MSSLFSLTRKGTLLTQSAFMRLTLAGTVVALLMAITYWAVS